MQVNYGSISGQVVEYGYAGAFTAGPDLTVPASLTEGDTATITLSGNTNPPTAARLNGTVVVLTSVGAGSYTFPVPRLPDDPAAEVQVDVDGYTVADTTNYSNLFPHANTAHGQPHPKSALHLAKLATFDPYEIRIASDTDPAVMTVDWAQIDTDGAWLDDITPYITLASGLEDGTSSATLEIYRHEQGDVVSRIVTIEDQGPNGTVTIDDITESRNGATISFSYDRADADGFKYSLDDGATWAITSSPTELSGLTSSTPYNYWVAAYDVDGLGVITKTTFTTLAAVDTKPDPFTVVDRTDVALSTDATPNKVVFASVTVKGVDAATDVPLSISGDTGSEYRYSSDGGATWSPWATAPANVRLNYQIQAQHDASKQYSSGGYDGVRQTTLDVGTTLATFTSTTVPDNTKPVISLQGGNLNWEQGTPWVEPGYSATDNADGDITANVVITGTVDPAVLGPVTLTYSVTDASGNTGTASRVVTVVEAGSADNVAPVISLVGGNQTLIEGEAWVDPGYTATDNVDGDITANVVVTGSVNTAVPAPYTLTYSVTDAAGNTGSVTRTVTVLSSVGYPFAGPAPAERTFNAVRVYRPELGTRTFVMKTGEILDFDFDLTAWLAAQGNDTLSATYDLTEEAEALGIEAFGRVTGTDRIKVWLSAGVSVSGESYPVQLTLTTTGSRTAVFQIRIIII